MRKFLYTIVILIVLAAGALFALRLYGDKLTELALVPSSEFVEQEPLASNAYQNPDMWFSRPGMGAPNDPARWQPGETASPASSPQGSPSPRITPDRVIEDGASARGSSAAPPVG